MVIVAGFIIVLIVIVAIVMFTIINDSKKIAKEEKKKEEEAEQAKKNEEAKLVEVISEKNFETLITQAKDDLDKLEILERRIQDILRKSVKEKNIYNARVCNRQLKQIDELKDRKERK